MTAQMNDLFRYDEKQFLLAGISEGELFDISLLDLNPAAVCSGCWRGYQAVFAVADARLVLESLRVNLLRPTDSKNRYDCELGPVINGVIPSLSKKKFEIFNNRYEGLNYHLEYSGGLLLADGFIQELYVHMGFQPAWKYETVIELIFDAGVLKNEFNRSEQMAELREAISQSRKTEDSGEIPSEEEFRQFVERAFDRRYSR